MRKALGAVVGICLALPVAFENGTARAASSNGGRYIYVPPGAEVVVLPNISTTAPTGSDQSIDSIFDVQERMMRRMMADIDSFMSMSVPDPDSMVRSVINGMPRMTRGSGIVVTSVTSGNTSCSQTITYGSPGQGRAPLVKVMQTGNGCGAVTSSGPVDVMQPLRAPEPAEPRAVEPRHARVWTVGNPPHRIVLAGTPPRT